MADRLRVQLGLTQNLGNFESLRLDASFETDVRADETEEEAFSRAWDTVDKQVASQIESRNE